MLTVPLTPLSLGRDQRGVAMLEFVLMLPFVWVVLALILNFGLAFLERQRTLVAARELGIRHSVARARVRAAPVQSVGDRVTSQLLAPMGMSSEYTTYDTGACPQDGEPVDAGSVRDGLGMLLSFLGDTSASRSYRVRAEGRPVVGTLLPKPVHGVCFAIDSGTWTHAETGEPMDWLLDQIGGLGSTISGAFK